MIVYGVLIIIFDIYCEDREYSWLVGISLGRRVVGDGFKRRLKFLVRK